MQQQHFQPCPCPPPVDGGGGGRGSVTKEKWKRAVYLSFLHRQWQPRSLLSSLVAEAAEGTAAPGEFLDQWHNMPVRTRVSEDVSNIALLEGLNSMGELICFMRGSYKILVQMDSVQPLHLAAFCRVKAEAQNGN